MTAPAAEQDVDLGGIGGLGMSAAERELDSMFTAIGDDTPPEPATPKDDAPPEPEAAPPDAEPADPDAPPPAPVVDPLAELTKDAKPLAYKVSGAERVADYILSLGDKGAYIPPDKVARIQAALASSDANRESNKTLYEQVQRYEAIGGLDKMREQAAQLASVNAVGGLLFEHLTDPTKLLSLLTLDANNRVVPNMDAIEMLRERARLLNDRATLDTQREWGTKTQAAEQTVQEQTLRTTAIPDAIDRAFGDADAADRESAKAYFQQFADSLLFKAGADAPEKYGVAPGTLMVDVSKMAPWFADRAENRARTKTEAEARSKAEKENKARLAQKPADAPDPTRVPPRKPNGEFRAPKPGEKMRMMTKSEVLAAIKRGDDLPEDGRVPA